MKTIDEIIDLVGKWHSPQAKALAQSDRETIFVFCQAAQLAAFERAAEAAKNNAGGSEAGHYIADVIRSLQPE